MAIKGSLREASLADICQLLAMGMKSGRLSVTDRSRLGQVYFRNGRITYASIINRKDRIGDLLLAQGALTASQLRSAVEAQSREPERKLGQILVSRGLIDEERLGQVIRLQIEEAVYHLFTWTRGSFYFEADLAPDEGELLVSINPESLLLEGARRVDEWSVIAKKIPHMDLLFQVDAKRLEGSDVALTPEQERVVPLLDGLNTVQDVADRSGLGEFESGKAIYGLIQAGFATRVGRRSGEGDGRARASDPDERRNLGIAFYRMGMPAEAEREFRRVLELSPEDPEARRYLALLALRRGKAREAVHRLKKLVDDHGPAYESFMNLAVALRELGRSEDAALVLDEAERSRPGRPEAALLGAYLAAEEGRLDRAAELLERYELSTDPRNRGGAFHHLAALLAALQGDLERADDLARSGMVTEEGEDNVPLLLLAGAIAERRFRLDEAARLYRAAAEADPDLPQAQKALGDLAYRQGTYPEALDRYQRAVELDPELGDDVHAKLGNLHFKRGERVQAIHHWRQSAALNPDNEVVRKNLAAVGEKVPASS